MIGLVLRLLLGHHVLGMTIGVLVSACEIWLMVLGAKRAVLCRSIFPAPAKHLGSPLKRVLLHPAPRLGEIGAEGPSGPIRQCLTTPVACSLRFGTAHSGQIQVNLNLAMDPPQQAIARVRVLEGSGALFQIRRYGSDYIENFRSFCHRLRPAPIWVAGTATTDAALIPAVVL